MAHFRSAIDRLVPSLGHADVAAYVAWRARMMRLRLVVPESSCRGSAVRSGALGGVRRASCSMCRTLRHVQHVAACAAVHVHAEQPLSIA
eukprot:364401-Chlamydomonas_euryale.AAC.6